MRRALLAPRQLGTVKKTLFAGEMSCPPWSNVVTKRIDFYYEWNPDRTTVTKVMLYWAVETDAWGLTQLNIYMNGKFINGHAFTGPGFFNSSDNVTDKFFNGPNIFLLEWWRLFTFPWYVNCKVRLDIEITYEGSAPPEPDKFKEYIPWLVAGAVVGTGIVLVGAAIK